MRLFGRYLVGFLVGLIGLILAYLLCCLLMFFALGFFLLPVVVVGSFVGLFFLWKHYYRGHDKLWLSRLVLFLSYIILIAVHIFLDKPMSWDGQGNLKLYLSLFGFGD